MSAYYNEHDSKAAAWLRELIAQGLIAPGDVDERDIRDITPAELAGYTQCHFFAGIGGWSYALRLAGWPDDRPVWTGSCPCQPFSAAGKGGGFADERHLWPAFHWLIEQCRPSVVFGEQVASPAGRKWLDLVATDLEGTGYAVGAANLPAASVEAPHLRERLWWIGVALGDSDITRSQGRIERRDRADQWVVGQASMAGSVADPEHSQRRSISLNREDGRHGPDAVSTGRTEGRSLSRPGQVASSSSTGDLGDAADEGDRAGNDESKHERRPAAIAESRSKTFWSACDWIYCRDDKWRAVEPGTFPLAYGLPARVGRLRGYGNAIVPQVAAEVIRAYMETR